MKKGDEGFEQQVDKLFYLANLLYEQLKQRSNFEIVLHDVNILDTLVLCCVTFRFIFTFVYYFSLGRWRHESRSE